MSKRATGRYERTAVGGEEVAAFVPHRLEDRVRVLQNKSMSVAALRLFELLPRHPVVSVASTMKLLKTSKPTARRAVEMLVEAGVLVETTGKKRDRWYAYESYLERLRAGTELDVQRRSAR